VRNLKNYLGLVSDDAGDIDELARQFKSLGSSERRHYAQAMFRILTSKKHASDLNIRMGAINVLLALPPLSLPALWKLVRGAKTPMSCEVAFTLFLFLYYGNQRFKGVYIRMAEWYLLHTKSNLGSAAHEAAYYLASSCHYWAGVQSLFRVVRNGKTLAGRIEAVRALSSALMWQVGRRKQKVLSFLKATTRHPNKKLRWHAEMVLKFAPLYARRAKELSRKRRAATSTE
jgi:hypothetical protein